MCSTVALATCKRAKGAGVARCALGEERGVQVVFHEFGQHGTASGLRLEVAES